MTTMRMPNLAGMSLPGIQPPGAPPLPPTNIFSRSFIKYVRRAIVEDIPTDVEQKASVLRRFDHDNTTEVESFLYRDKEEWLSFNTVVGREFIYRIAKIITGKVDTSQWVKSPDDAEDEIRYVKKSFLRDYPDLLEEFFRLRRRADSAFLKFLVGLDDRDVILTEKSSDADKARWLTHRLVSAEPLTVPIDTGSMSFNGRLSDVFVAAGGLMGEFMGIMNLGRCYRKVLIHLPIDRIDLNGALYPTPDDPGIGDIPAVRMVHGQAETVLTDIYDDAKMAEALQQQNTSMYSHMAGSAVNTASRTHQQVVVLDGDLLATDSHSSLDKLLGSTGLSSMQGTALEAIDDDERELLVPCHVAYGLTSKQWLLAHQADLSPVPWSDQVFDELITKPGLKETMLALASTESVSLDLVAGKGDNTTFLLVGGPGTGKTLSAEALSHKLQKPLMKTTVSDLGTKADVVERRLTKFLELANRWNCMVLIDEADMFIEERDVHSLERNAIVNSFLRVLEYFKGVAFLTTNRERSIDPAVYSRMTLVAHYRREDLDQTQLWTDLLKRAGCRHISEQGVAKLTALEMNGRVAKNVVATTMRLCQHTRKRVTMRAVLDTAKVIVS